MNDGLLRATRHPEKSSQGASPFFLVPSPAPKASVDVIVTWEGGENDSSEFSPMGTSAADFGNNGLQPLNPETLCFDPEEYGSFHRNTLGLGPIPVPRAPGYLNISRGQEQACTFSQTFGSDTVAGVSAVILLS